MSPDQQYWLPGYGLSRHIVLGHIHYFLGPTASVRPYSYQVCQVDTSAPLRVTCPNHISLEIKGREGYLINGVPLTRVCSPFMTFFFDILQLQSWSSPRYQILTAFYRNKLTTSQQCPGSTKDRRQLAWPITMAPQLPVQAAINQPIIPRMRLLSTRLSR
jgi:hypothetical protein